MRFLLDESVPLSLGCILRERSHDVVAIREMAGPGLDDDSVFVIAKRDGRILISLDYRDFSNIIHFSPQGTYGIIVAHMPKVRLVFVVERIMKVLEAVPPEFWKDRLTIIEADRLRQRSFL